MSIDYISYFHQKRNAQEFFTDYEKQIELWDKTENDKRIIEERKKAFCGFEFSDSKYEEFRKGCESFSVENVLELSQYIEPIITILRKHPFDRYQYLTQMSSFDILRIIILCIDKYKEKNITFTKQDMAESVIYSADNLAGYYFNEPEVYKNGTGMMNVKKLSKHYPKSIVTLNSNTIKELIKPYKPKSKQIVLINPEDRKVHLLKNPNDLSSFGVDKENLTYFDIHVYEAIMTLFNSGKKIDLKRIYKILMGDTEARISTTQIQNCQSSEIFQSIQKLRKYRVINKSTGDFYSDKLLNGTIHFINGEMVLEVVQASQFYEDVEKNNGLRHINFQDVGLSKDFNYNKIRIALKRYLMQVIEDARQKGDTFYKINIDKLKNTLIENQANPRSFKSTQRENTVLLLEEFKNNRYIKSFKEDKSPWDTITIFF